MKLVLQSLFQHAILCLTTYPRQHVNELQRQQPGLLMQGREGRIISSTCPTAGPLRAPVPACALAVLAEPRGGASGRPLGRPHRMGAGRHTHPPQGQARQPRIQAEAPRVGRTLCRLLVGSRPCRRTRPAHTRAHRPPGASRTQQARHLHLGHPPEINAQQQLCHVGTL